MDSLHGQGGRCASLNAIAGWTSPAEREGICDLLFVPEGSGESERRGDFADGICEKSNPSGIGQDKQGGGG